ncbi:hypothetical protein TEA_014884 [Camellia sinensis var. sinensis]|uniref:Anaphase-promoting complex subunit 4 WD40 domain-containing protein n=1 Tax=Camellia sinensis var. sinensis TaxID=542762 RepID=A0A4S4E158_CAMSN|nr:hypothetical protein TEA_014884 [Camellia sinensis var. sinensis]
MGMSWYIGSALICSKAAIEYGYTLNKDCRCSKTKMVRYHLDEDPKTLKVFPIPLHDSSGTTLHYDHLSISPDGRMLAATHGSTLQWLSAETGQVLDTADRVHDPLIFFFFLFLCDITGIAWSPRAISMGDKQALVLATSSVDKKVKLWAPPNLA